MGQTRSMSFWSAPFKNDETHDEKRRRADGRADPPMRTKSARLAFLAFASLAASALSGCTEPTPHSVTPNATNQPTSAQTYEYGDLRVTTPSDVPPQMFDGTRPVVIRLSEELKKAAPAGTQIAVDHFTISMKSFATGICRTDVRITYSSGGLDALRKAAEDARHAQVEAAKQAIAAGYDVSEDRAVYTKPTIDDIVPAGVSGLDPDKIVKKLPTDDELEPDAKWLKEDGSALTATGDCKDARYPAATLEFAYPDLHDDRGDFRGSSYLARSQVAGATDSPGTSTGQMIGVKSDVAADVSVTGKWKVKATV